MEAVGGATSSLLTKLGALLQDEYNLQDKVKRDIESLQHELVFMNATLRMVAEVPRDKLDEHVRIWAIIIKEVSYDMEDVVSTFVARVHGAPHLDGLITKFFNMFCMGYTHHQIAGMVEEIRSLIKEVADLRDRYRFDSIVIRAATPLVLPPRENMLTRYLADDCEEITRQHIGIKYEELVVVKENMKVLHNWITSGESNVLTTLCLVGPAGVGKTTIAMALYRNYGDQFQFRAIVNMSCYSGDYHKLLVDILSKFKPQDLQGHDGDIDQIRSELRECLRGKRFLILIEDVGSAMVLDQIRTMLSESWNGSKVIVTTRFDAVVPVSRRYSGDYCIHKLGLLSEQNAELLFMKIMGKQNRKVIPNNLWKMCGGLPLAIVTMAGQFACNPWKSDEDWIKVSSALPPTSSTSHTNYNLTKILNTCYNDMISEIKTCALYFSIFLRGQTISRKRLTRRWISQGFVIGQQGLSAEDVAEIYLNHLIRRKFIQPTEHSSNGKVKSYQVHDMVHEYIVSKASEENFVTMIGDCDVALTSTKVRRLSVKDSDSSKHWEELETMNLAHVRDVTMSGSLKQLPSSSFKFSGVVQLLDLEGCKDFKQHHIKEICRMFLLKYLNLRRTDIKKLTKRIGDLQFLETLDIRETDVTELPNAICKLERLVNIFGGNKRTRKALKLPKELGKRKKMKALRILTGIEISEETTADLHHLTDLRKLCHLQA